VGSITRWYGTSTEIDGLQRAGAHGVDKPAILLDRVREGFVELDGDLAVVWLNRAAERVIERHRREVLGKHLLDVFPGARGSALVRKLDEARAGAAPIYVGEGLEVEQDLHLHDVRIYPERDPDSLTVFFAGRSTPDDQE